MGEFYGLRRSCPPGCQCKRHNPTHKPGCKCPRCRPMLSEESRTRTRKDRCVCGHIKSRHDIFGCRTCERSSPNGRDGAMCSAYCPKYGAAQEKQDSYAPQVRKYGFILHQQETATCTSCWTVIKIGFVHSVTCAINAKAHALKCQQHQREKQARTRPNRAG